MNRIFLIARISRRGIFGVMWREIDDSCEGSSRHLHHMALHELVEARLTGSVIGAFFEVYNNLGYGFLGHVYVMALERELIARKHRVAREVAVQVFYKGDHLAEQRLDMIVDQKLVVETKSTHELHKSANRQVYNYLRSTETKTTQIRVIRKIRFIRMNLPSRWSGPKAESSVSLRT
jgi:GxxExxY protein